MFVGKVVVKVPDMGGGFDDRDQGDLWEEEYPTYDEAEAFVSYWRNYDPRPGVGKLIFISGEVVERD